MLGRTSMLAVRRTATQLQALATPAAARRLSKPGAGTKENMSAESLEFSREAVEGADGAPKKKTCIASADAFSVGAAMGGGKEHLAEPLTARGLYGPGRLREGV